MFFYEKLPAMESPGQNPFRRRRIDRRAIWLSITIAISIVFLYTFYSVSGLSGYEPLVVEPAPVEAPPAVVEPTPAAEPTESQDAISDAHNDTAALAPAGHRIVRCTALIGDRSEAYEALLETHIAYNHRYDYPMEIFRDKVVDGMWNKDAAIMTTLLDHLSKPKAAGRYDWLVWSDADVAIMNPEIPLTAYLPPRALSGYPDESPDEYREEADVFADVHLLYSSDPNGLNAGIFFLRVSEWSVNFLSAILAYRSFRPDDDLPYAEQDAMARLLELPAFAHGGLELPEKSLSVYPDGGWAFEPGQLMLHFAGQSPKEKVIFEWLEKLEANPEEYSSRPFAEEFEAKMNEWWGKKAEERQKRKQEEEKKKQKEEEEKQAEEEKQKAKEQAEAQATTERRG